MDTSGLDESLDASAAHCPSAARCPTAAGRTASVNGCAAPSVACAAPSGRGGADATTAAAFHIVSPAALWHASAHHGAPLECAAVRSCLAPSAAPRPQHPRPRLQSERRWAGVPEGRDGPRCTHQPTDAVRPPHGKGPRQGRAGRAWCAQHGADSRWLGVRPVGPVKLGRVRCAHWWLESRAGHVIGERAACAFRRGRRCTSWGGRRTAGSAGGGQGAAKPGRDSADECGDGWRRRCRWRASTR